MQVAYKNKRLEKVLIAINISTAVVVVGTFVLLFGLQQPLLPAQILFAVQYILLFIFIAEKAVRLFNSMSLREFWRANWYEAPLLLALAVAAVAARGRTNAETIRHFAVGIYLVLQVVVKVCRTTVDLASSGKNPTRTLIASFVILILSGTGVLMLPKSTSTERVGFVDALFTAASATCVTGLVVKDVGRDYSLMGQVTILSLIQLGGLGIVIFGAVFALLLGQALSIRESAAMQDLLSEQTLGRISKMIAFVFVATVLIEGLGALTMLGMWDDVPGRIGSIHQQWYCSIFHSISAFCNAGFGLFSDNLISYNRCWPVYVVICPLIIIGGLGFGVLYDLTVIAAGRIAMLLSRFARGRALFDRRMPRKMQLQTKVVLVVTTCLIVFGMSAVLLFERFTGGGKWDIGGAFFQSVTARTAGFNTVEISELSASSKFILILLMFIGGSPGGTAGGIKTVTLAVIIMAAVTTLKKRDEVHLFRRSVGLIILRRAITVTLLFILVLFTAALALTITEHGSGFTLMDVFFETASALGTVGLSTGVTPSLTTAGKLIIIVVMLTGRLGPLTLLAAVTFNLKPARYSYPQEAIIVG
jgi:trk system potassium uptake protein TrkH